MAPLQTITPIRNMNLLYHKIQAKEKLAQKEIVLFIKEAMICEVLIFEKVSHMIQIQYMNKCSIIQLKNNHRK